LRKISRLIVDIDHVRQSGPLVFGGSGFYGESSSCNSWRPS
jgi:hypothetical protein